MLSSYFFKEVLKKPIGIFGTGSGFWMKLHRKKWQIWMIHTFVTVIVGIDKPGLKIRWQLANCEAMILSCDIAAVRVLQDTGLILTAMAKFQLIGCATCGKGQQLMTQADTHRR